MYSRTALTFEGDTQHVLQALVTDKPIYCVSGGGGMGGAAAAGLAAALEALHLRQHAPFTGTAVSVGVVNQILATYRQGQQLTRCYCTDFCTSRFIERGVTPWFTGTKISVAHYGAVLRQKLRMVNPAHADSQLRIGVTNYETGEYTELMPELADTARVARAAMASAHLPCIGKGYTIIDGVPYTDGGVSEQLPLPATVSPQSAPLLIMPATPEYAGSRTQQLLERFVFRSAPATIRERIAARRQQFCDRIAYIRAQLALPLSDPGRQLPPTCIVWPQAINLVEQRLPVVQRVVGESYQAWYDTLRLAKQSGAA